MTEDKASARWCPFVRYGFVTDGGGLNAWKTTKDEYLRVPATCLCIASRCMAWRWAEPEPHASDCIAIATQTDPKPRACDCQAYKRRKGFCGLAGSPTP